MRQVFIITLLIFISKSIFSQDLIVTNDGDSINCKITAVEADRIYFTFKHNDEIRNTLLPQSNIKTHQLNYFPTSEVPTDNLVDNNNSQRLRFAFNVGYSRLTAGAPEGLSNDFAGYIKDLKNGFHFGGDLTYYFKEQFGVGAKCYFFKTTTSSVNIYVEQEAGGRVYGKMSDDITTSFIGPMFSTRYFDKKKRNALYINYSLGYMGYSNNAVFINNYKYTGNTVGLSIDVGYDIKVSEKASVGFQISFIAGTLSRIKVDNGVTTQTVELKKNSREGLGRIDLSVGFRFNQ